MDPSLPKRKAGRPTGPVYPRKIRVDFDTRLSDNLIGAYTITHVPSGKQYHGSTENLHRRLREHETDLRTKTHRNEGLQKLYQDSGYLYLIFYPTETRDAAYALEQSLIDSTDLDFLLNVSYSSRNLMTGLWSNPNVREKFSKTRIGNKHAQGAVYSTERRQSISERLKGNKHLLGHVHNAESRKRMSIAGKGRKHTAEHVLNSSEGRTKYRINIDGVEYKNSAEAAKAIGMTAKGITKRCRSGKYPTWLEVKKVNDEF